MSKLVSTRTRWLVISVLFACGLSSPAVYADSARADELYRDGVELAQRGQLEKARAQFERAYELSPHPDVLFNLGRVCLDLDDLDAAADYLQRYLDTGGDALSAQRREEVNRTLRLIARQRDEARAAVHASAPSQQAQSEESSRGSAAGSTAENGDAARRQHARAVGEPVTPVSSREPVGLTLGVVGLSALAGGVGLFIYALEREAALEKTQRKLEGSPPGDVTNDASLNNALEHAQEQGLTAGRLETADALQLTSWILMGAGAVTAGIGGWLYFGAESAPVQVSVGPDRVRLRMTW